MIGGSRIKAPICWLLRRHQPRSWTVAGVTVTLCDRCNADLRFIRLEVPS